MVLENLFDWIFAPLTSNLSPRWALILISFLITLFVTLVYKFFTNQELMKNLKSELKTLQKEMKDAKDDPKKASLINKNLMQKNLEYMKHSMKPTFITFIPIILIFTWLKQTFLPAGYLFSWSFNVPILGAGIGWLWTYLLSSIIFSMLLRRLLKIH